MLGSPAFGQADLTNCERELIHLAGSVQPHGVLLVLREPELAIIQASANCEQLLGRGTAQLLLHPLADLGSDLTAAVRRAAAEPLLEPGRLRASVPMGAGAIEFEGSVHRVAGAGLVLELEPRAAVDPHDAGIETVDCDTETLLERVNAAVERFSVASNIGALSHAVVGAIRDLTGYDRVMVYRFDPDGHGKIIAEARHARLESLLGHQYPASDIPQRARELYIRNRVRVLVDVGYQAARLEPPLLPDGQPLDMSLSYLRSMSPLHIQYLKNMGVTATLVASLVREGRLWGLIACHHYSPRNLSYAVRAACELLAEVVATRIAAIENYAHAQVAILVRRLEQRLIEATSTDGDWRLALFRNPRVLLQPLDATGAALFHDGEITTAGEVPSTPELQAVLRWVDAQVSDTLYATNAIGRLDRSLESLTPTASGVLAMRLSATRPDFLMWFRKEQLQSVTWAGDPSKPVIVDDPLHLSPRRSFAAWSEIVRGTALPWSGSELVLARAIGTALIDIIVQVHAVRLLIAEHQVTQLRSTVLSSNEPVVIANPGGRLLFSNDAFYRLAGRTHVELQSLQGLAGVFADAGSVRELLARLLEERTSWRGELRLRNAAAGIVPVHLRAEVVPSRDGSVLGYMLTLMDLTDRKRTAAARLQLEQSLSNALDADGERTPDKVIGAIMANASLAAMDIADAVVGPEMAPLLEEVEASARRAAALYTKIRTNGR
ncbi:MAG: GAF domain-containing protein [Burkholderiaceae bacterium]|nr:GAF domain-containing protein [Burkholderiaceae bacterium]